MKIQFNGAAKQNAWAEGILTEAQLTKEQIENLLRWGGPTLFARQCMDVTMIIENRHALAVYADVLGKFYTRTANEKHQVAQSAIDAVRSLAGKGTP